MAANVENVPEPGADRVVPDYDQEKNITTVHQAPDQADLKDSDANSEKFQGGVQRARAITTIWSRKELWAMFILLYLVSFVDAILVSVQGALNPYMTSEFSRHGLLASVGVVSSILAGCSTLTLAKVVDIWGRIEGFLAMLLVVTVSLIMKATCHNMEMYFAAHTFYWTAHIGMIYVIDVMLADCTTLKNRMLISTINGTPTIASTFAGPRIADLFFTHHNFRWAFGAFAIMLVGICIPVVAVMLFMQRKAFHAGLLTKEKSNRTIVQSIWHYFLEFDVVGIVLITAGFSLVLLPFSIAVYAPNGWETGYIIAMEVLGILIFPAFFAYEKWVAPVQFLPWFYLKNRTILGSCLLYAAMFISCFAWNSFFYSYLQVVHRLSITTAGYVLNSYSLSAAIISPFVSAIISYTGDFKWTAYTGVPCILLGTALLIPFRKPDTHVGILVVTQILNGIGTGLFATCGQLAVQVPVTHQEVAAVLAVWGMFGSIGAGIGSSMAGAIWNNLLPGELYNRLPESSKNMSMVIFGDMVAQMSYEDGTAERDAIVGAYAHVQRLMVIAGACFTPLCLAAIFVWRNTNVRKLEQERGTQMKGVIF